MGLDFKVLFRCVLTVDILLCVAIIAANLLLLLAIVTSRPARARPRNAMLVSVCLADLMVGVFTHPLYIHSYRTATLFHSCQLHIVMQLIGDYAQDFVCYWTLVTLGAQYAARLTAHRWGWTREAPGSYRPLNDPLPTRWRSAARAVKKFGRSAHPTSRRRLCRPYSATGPREDLAPNRDNSAKSVILEGSGGT